jgi:hypothetical protein
MVPSELLGYDSRLVAFMKELPFYEASPVLASLNRKRAA